MKKDVVVQKFGGSSVASPEKIRDVAEFIKHSLVKKQICVVVSAMGQTTNELINLAHRINPEPPKREMDMLISCGERSSMSLLAMALAKINVRAISLTGSQSGIITDDNHSGAEIIALRPARIIEAFKDYDVVIVAGFQGISRNKEITTLKRGGSDTTAVALTAALDAQLCEIYTDVPGVMDCDPRIISLAQPIKTLSYAQMSSMSLYGAKVLAHDAANIAKELNVSLLIAETGSNEGTWISEKIIRTQRNGVSAISHLRGIIRVSMALKDAQLDWHNYFLCGQVKEGYLWGYVSNDIAQELSPSSSHEPGLALITLQIGDRRRVVNTVVIISNILDKNNIIIMEAMIGFSEIFIIVSDKDLINALNHIHTACMVEGKP